jgi:hypothetical protein
MADRWLTAAARYGDETCSVWVDLSRAESIIERIKAAQEATT